MERFGLRNDQWDRIKDVLPGREGHVGARRKIIERSSKLTKRFSTDLELGVHGAICRSVSATGKRSINGSRLRDESRNWRRPVSIWMRRTRNVELHPSSQESADRRRDRSSQPSPHHPQYWSYILFPPVPSFPRPVRWEAVCLLKVWSTIIEGVRLAFGPLPRLGQGLRPTLV
jgi:hypothetical protein